MSCGLRVLSRNTSFVAISVEATFSAGALMQMALVIHDARNEEQQSTTGHGQQKPKPEHVRIELPTSLDNTPNLNPATGGSASTHLRVLVDKGVVELFVDKGATSYSLYHRPEYRPGSLADSDTAHNNIAAFLETNADQESYSANFSSLSYGACAHSSTTLRFVLKLGACSSLDFKWYYTT
eukprot:CAMPEP_0171699966 /NCGR_PEP_ID=MMETSP0991-20121206/10279_1 /TAXON_ID=483369 /ORGANISM="non described non described, Strain CCMP2098" /LENGTH=180 /DNA_ID=CAMNT_0012289147 /DNA_START=239 /DNA_END=777 /DNA_ORIENTATION=-